MTAGTRGSARIDRPGQAQPCSNMRFPDVAAGAFGQPYQHNQLDAPLLAFAQRFHHRLPPDGARSSPPSSNPLPPMALL